MSGREDGFDVNAHGALGTVLPSHDAEAQALVPGPFFKLDGFNRELLAGRMPRKGAELGGLLERGKMQMIIMKPNHKYSLVSNSPLDLRPSAFCPPHLPCFEPFVVVDAVVVRPLSAHFPYFESAFSDTLRPNPAQPLLLLRIQRLLHLLADGSSFFGPDYSGFAVAAAAACVVSSHFWAGTRWNN